MRTLDVVTYAGSTSADGFDDLTTGPEVASAVDGADGLVILDPLSFPWEAFEDAPHCPVIVDLANCDDQDLTALVPVLTILTSSDLLLGEESRVQMVCATVGLPLIWGTRADVDSHIEEHGSPKTLDVQIRSITERLASEDDVTAIILSGDEVRSWRRGFSALVDHIRDRDDELANAQLEGIWGIHPRPGEPLQRAVLAFRTVQPPIAEP